MRLFVRSKQATEEVKVFSYCQFLVCQFLVAGHIGYNVLRLIFRADYEEPTVCRDKRWLKIQNFLFPRPPA